MDKNGRSPLHFISAGSGRGGCCSPLTRALGWGGAAAVAVCVRFHKPTGSQAPADVAAEQALAQLRADHGPRLTDAVQVLWPAMSFERLYRQRLVAYGEGVGRLVHAQGGSGAELAAVLAEALVRAKAAEQAVWKEMMLNSFAVTAAATHAAAWNAYAAHVEEYVLATRHRP